MYTNNSLDIIIALFNNEYIMVIAFIVFIGAIGTDKSLTKKDRQYMVICAFICVCHTIFAFIDFGISSSLLPTNIPLRIFASAMRHIDRPVTLVLATCSFAEHGLKHKIFFLPLLINTILYLVNIWTGI